MFLASQLEDVARRYPTYVAELRGFFVARGVPVDTSDSLVKVAERLEGDRGFHRGVSTLLESMMYRQQEQMSPADLMAMLMVAAQGAVAQEPSAAEDRAIQTLLGFVLRLREAMRHVDEAASAALVIAPEIPRKSDELPVPFEETPEKSWIRKNAIPVGSAAVLLLGLGGYGIWYGMQKPAAPATVVVTQSAEQPVEAPQVEPETAVPPVKPAFPHAAVKEKSHPGHVAPSQVITQPARSAVPATPPPQRAASSPPQPATTEVQPQQHAENLTASAAPVRRRLPMPSVRPRRVPGLGTDASATVPLEWMAPKAAPAEPRVSSPTVTPTALGVMAANLMYSPAPAYPAEANAAHVEGQVKVEATVGNDGSVTSARVISGPELLRGAALGAVQRWHYRPYVEGGKARTVTTTALLDFQLP